MRITADHAMEPSALGLPLERRGSSLALVPISGAVSWQSPELICSIETLGRDSRRELIRKTDEPAHCINPPMPPGRLYNAGSASV